MVIVLASSLLFYVSSELQSYTSQTGKSCFKSLKY